MARKHYVLALLGALLALAPAYADTPGKVRKIVRQEGGSSSFTGGTLTSDLDMGDNDILGANVIQPTSGETLVINDQSGTAALTVLTNGGLDVANYLALGDVDELYFGAGLDSVFFWSTAQTNDALMLALDDDGGSPALILALKDANQTGDLGLADYTDPTLVLTSATSWGSDTTEWASLSVATGGAFQIATGATAHQFQVLINGTLDFAVSDTTTRFYTAGVFTGNTVYGVARRVTTHTEVAASPNALSTSDDNWNVLTNEGTAAENHHDLPTAAAGLTYTFVVQDANGIQINAATGDTIRIAGTASASGGFISSTTVGDSITLVAINATEWVAVCVGGNNWTFDT